MEKKYLRLNDIEAYRIAFHLSNSVWNIILKWGSFEKDTVGKQFVRAVDSVAANIAEGFGRYSKKDKVKFYRYTYGSVLESLDWNEKAKVRQLVSIEQYDTVFQQLQRLPKAINSLIKYTNENLSE